MKESKKSIACFVIVFIACLTNCAGLGLPGCLIHRKHTHPTIPTKHDSGERAILENNLKQTSVCWDNIDFEETEKILLEAPIRKIIPITEYLNLNLKKKKDSHPLILVFNNNLKAVFKYGRDKRQMSSSLVSYLLSKRLNLRFIPPTVVRSVNGRIGTVRLFIEEHKVSSEKDRLKYMKELPPLQKSDFYTLSFFFAGDLTLKNMIISKNCKKLVIIDNDKHIYFPNYIKYGDYPFIHYMARHFEFKIRDAEEFPYEKVKYASVSEMKKKMPPYYLWSRNVINGKYGYVKFRNKYWIYAPHITYRLFKPKIFSKDTLNNLKSLNHRGLYQTLYVNHPFTDHIIPRPDFIDLVLHRRNLLLREADTRQSF